MAMGVEALLLFLAILQPTWSQGGGILYPRESESRQIQYLDGMWDFRADMSPNRQRGLEEKWFKQKLSQVRVTCAGVNIWLIGAIGLIHHDF